jgi:hypothetical protein
VQELALDPDPAVTGPVERGLGGAAGPGRAARPGRAGLQHDQVLAGDRAAGGHGERGGDCGGRRGDGEEGARHQGSTEQGDTESMHENETPGWCDSWQEREKNARGHTAARGNSFPESEPIPHWRSV